MQRSGRNLFVIGLAIFIIGPLIPPGIVAAGVDVYAEGAYTDTDLAVYIYADISDSALCSFGVKLTYSTSELLSPVAEKNEDAWYMGDGTPGGNYSYMDPDTATPGEVVFIGGKLNTTSPTTGVSGDRILLGKVTFSRVTLDDPGEYPELFFGIELGLGKENPYDNFVTTSETVMDGSVTFGSIIVAERGDANASGGITVRDISTVKTLLRADDYRVYADCNASGSLTVRDISCIKVKLRE
jgi:hypothetical protein